MEEIGVEPTGRKMNSLLNPSLDIGYQSYGQHWKIIKTWTMSKTVEVETLYLMYYILILLF
jgi:hypothetical protein